MDSNTNTLISIMSPKSRKRVYNKLTRDYIISVYDKSDVNDKHKIINLLYQEKEYSFLYFLILGIFVVYVYNYFF